MQKKKHAAIAIALVTGSFSMPQVSRAGLFATPLQNGTFDYDYNNNPNGIGYDYQLHGWFHYSGGETWQAQSTAAISFPGAFSNSAYAVVQGVAYRGSPASTTTGDIYQQIGTTSANLPVSVNFLEAYLKGASNSVTVSLFSGGSPSRDFNGYTGGYNVYGPTYTLNGATLLDSMTFAADTANPAAFEQEAATLNTGTAGTNGAALWLDFTVNNTNYSVDQIALDNVIVNSTTATPVSTWTGGASRNWNTTELNFGAEPYADGNAVVFDDNGSNTTININTADVSPTEVTFNNSSKNYTLTGAFGIAGGAQLTMNGAGTVTITNANSFTGPVNINAGVVNLQNSLALGSSTGVSVASGATLQLQGGITVGATPGTLPLTLAGAGTGTAGQDGALVNLSGTNTYSGKLLLSGAATIAVDSGSLILNDGTDIMTTGVGPGYDLTLTGSGTGLITGKVGGDSALIKNGTGTWTLSAPAYFGQGLTVNAGTLNLQAINYYSGDTIVNGGTLNIGAGGPAGGIRGNLTVNAGGTVELNAVDALGYNNGAEVENVYINGGTVDDTTTGNEGYITNFILNGGTLSSSGGGKYNFDSANYFGISSTASSVTSLVSAGVVLRTGTMYITTDAGSTPSGIDLNISGPISGSGYAMYKEGDGVLALTGANTYSGGTEVDSGTLQFGDGTAGHDGSLVSAGGIYNNSAVVYDTNSAQSYGGVISSGGSVTKTGPGNLTLSGSNTYSGMTTVAAGKLYVSGPSASLSPSSFVEVQSGATLGGSGTIGGSTTIDSGAAIEAGQNGAGKLTFSSPVTFNGTGSINFGTLSNYTSTTGINFAGGVSAAAGSVAVNVATLGTATLGNPYELITYSGTDPYGDLTLGTLPGRGSGMLVDNSASSEIDLVITGSDYLKWTAAGGSTVWNASSGNLNWKLNSNNTATYYIDNPGDAVVFDDNAASGTVNIATATVHPSSVTFANNTLPYTVSGAFGIAGNTGVTLTGTGTVTLATSNSFTGPVAINAGKLIISSDSNLGAGPGIQTDDIIIDGGTLVAAGSMALNVNRTVQVGDAGATIDLNSNAITSIGSIAGTGPVVINNTGGGAGSLALGGSDSSPTTTNTDTGTLTINGGTVSMGGAGISTYPSQKFSSITVNSPAILQIAGTHVFGYAGPPRPPIIINGGTVTNSLGNDNYLGPIIMTGGAITGTGEFRLQDSPATFNTNSSPTTATVSVTRLSLVSDAVFTTDAGTGSGPDLLISSSITNTGSLTKSGPGSMTLSGSNTFTGGTIVTQGTLNLSGANAFPVGTALNISSGALVVATNHAANPNAVLQTTGVTFAGGTGSWGGTLDLNNNDLVIANFYGSLSDVTNQIQQGFNGGAWNGTGGITSTAAATDAKHLTALGAIVNDNGSGSPIYGNGGTFPSFDGDTSVADGDILVKYTYYGDANLDGAVDGSDYTLIDAGFNSNGALTGWYNGDFNYDGKIDGSDYTLIDNAFNTQGTSLGANPAGLIAGSTAQFADAVPEPTTLGTLAIGAIGLLAKRRRRR